MARVQTAPTLAMAVIAARIDRLPASRPLWSWVARISFGAFFEIYETALTSLLPPLLVRAGLFNAGRGGLFGLPDLATFGFATFMGLFVGALVSASLADRLGRRPIFTYSLLWYAAATLLMGVRADAVWICFWRLIAAIGVGAEIIAVDSYTAEMLPKSMRGRGFAISKAIQYTAVPVAGILAATLARKAGGLLQGWQVMLIVPSIGAVLIWWVRRGLPESPRWLAAQGRTEEACAILDQLELRIYRRGAQPLGELELAVAPSSLIQHNYAGLFRAPLLGRTIMLTVVSCATTVAYFGFSTWLPSLLEARGTEVVKSLTYTAVIAFSYPLTPLLISLIADRTERKGQIICGAAIVAAAGLLFSVQGTVLGLIVCGLFVTLGNNVTAYATHTYRSELFPTSVRARGIGLVYSIDRIVAAFNSYLIGFFLVEGGATAVLVTISAACLVAIGVVGRFGPRTRGVGADSISVKSAPE